MMFFKAGASEQTANLLSAICVLLVSMTGWEDTLAICELATGLAALPAGTGPLQPALGLVVPALGLIAASLGLFDSGRGLFVTAAGLFNAGIEPQSI